MIGQVAVSVFMSVGDAAFYASLLDESNTFTASEFESHIAYVDVPICAIQLFITGIVIYLLIILSRLTTNMVDKDDPFSNVYLIALIVLFVDS